MGNPLTDKDVSGIKDAIQKWVHVCLNADWDRCMELVTDDFAWLAPDEPIVEGKDGLRTWVERFPPIKKFSSTLVRAEGRDDFACARGTFTVTVESESGGSLLMKGKWSRIYRKQPDGSWLCASDTWNMDNPPTAV